MMMFFGGGMLLFWLLVIGGVIAAIGGLSGLNARSRQDSTGLIPQHGAKESAEEILRTRYAKGEINRDEYTQMATTLKS